MFFAQTVRMENLLSEAKRLQKTLVRYRRILHEHAEVGFDLPFTKQFVWDALEEIGCQPTACGRGGITTVIGSEEKSKKNRSAILLRADMDGLPIKEKTGLPFACKTGNMHACAHDIHTASLLGAARLLKAREKQLSTCVKLLFQPAEETLEGAKDCLDSGLLENPKVGSAVMLHALVGGKLPIGSVVVANAGVSAPAADYFKIEVFGKSCHGAAPQNGVDALLVATNILTALQTVSTREISANSALTLTVGKMQAGVAGNAIADKAVMQGTLRVYDEQSRAFVKQRVEQIVYNVAKTFRARAKTTFEGGCPTLYNEEKMVKNAYALLKKALGEKSVFSAQEMGDDRRKNGGSEDFSYISSAVPSVMIALCAGSGEDGYPLHHPKVVFDENALCYGATAYATIALANNSEK